MLKKAITFCKTIGVIYSCIFATLTVIFTLYELYNFNKLGVSLIFYEFHVSYHIVTLLKQSIVILCCLYCSYLFYLIVIKSDKINRNKQYWRLVYYVSVIIIFICMVLEININITFTIICIIVVLITFPIGLFYQDRDISSIFLLIAILTTIVIILQSIYFSAKTLITLNYNSYPITIDDNEYYAVISTYKNNYILMPVHDYNKDDPYIIEGDYKLSPFKELNIEPNTSTEKITIK